jgi:hypothetical protein
LFQIPISVTNLPFLRNPVPAHQGFPILAESRSAEGGSPLPEREVSSHKPLFSFSRAAAGGKHGELESPDLPIE